MQAAGLPSRVFLFRFPAGLLYCRREVFLRHERQFARFLVHEGRKIVHPDDGTGELFREFFDLFFGIVGRRRYALPRAAFAALTPSVSFPARLQKLR